MEEVKTGLIKKENFYLTLVNLLQEGKYPSSISKELNIPKQNLNYYLSVLKKKGIIEKEGYGLWKVKTSPTKILELIKAKQIRGHAFIWIIKIPQEIKGLREKALEIGKRLSRGQARLIIKEHKVWVGKENIVIYENKSFYGKNAIESRKYAVISLLEVLKGLEQQLNIKLSPYIFKPCKEHYGMIKNDLAVQCNRKKEKMLIHDDLEGDWLWIDDSESLGELEVSGKKALVRSKQVQNWWNDNKKHNFEVNSSFVLNAINQVTQNQLMFNQNFESHVEAIKTLSNTVLELRGEVKKLNKQNEMSKLLFYKNQKDTQGK